VFYFDVLQSAFFLVAIFIEGAANVFLHLTDISYEAYSESKYRFAAKKKKKKLSKVSYKMLLLSDSTFFKLFFHIFTAIIEALIVAGHKFLCTLLKECGRLRC